MSRFYTESEVQHGAPAARSWSSYRTDQEAEYDRAYQGAYETQDELDAARDAAMERMAKRTADQRARCSHRWISDSGRAYRYCMHCLVRETAAPEVGR